ncbi:MAG: Fe-S protein assembly chaperone HscA [Acidobacteria bacterium]|nr:Fe-S protein assembly chaperone HscA [Acidobacteriota bacterium]
MPRIELSLTGRPKSGRVVGIDLGTTNSLVAFMGDDAPQVIRGANDDALVPSIVFYDQEKKRLLIGEEARQRLITEPRKAIYSVKRFMGKGSFDVQEDLTLVPFQIAEGSEQVIRFQMGDKVFTPPEISAFILRELKERASIFFGEEVTRAVITVPAYFNDAQRQATKDAGHLAGLEVLRIVNEPTAASLAYGIDKRNEGLVAVYDLGGGTFDISILKLKDGIFEVLATNGDTHLGGDDIDNRLIAFVLEAIEQQTGKRVEQDPAAFQAVRNAVIAAKHELSNAESATIKIQLDSGEAFTHEITRADFTQRIADIIERTMQPCKQALRDADLNTEQIDEVVLVGGSTRIPLVRQRVKELFKREPHTELNPDEVVALGAAIQADILAGGSRDLLLLDVTPLSLGIETMGGVVAKIINRNSTIPASMAEHFTTWVDNQTGIDIHVVQGERELVEDCRSLARFTLKGIAPQPAGLPRIEVRFMIDANGILTVSAKDLRTQQQQSIEVKPSYGLTDEQVEKMLLDSYQFAEEDIRKRQVIEARTEADIVKRAAEKALMERGQELLGEDEQATVRQAIQELEEAMRGDDHLLIRNKIKELDEASHHLAELIMDNAVSAALKNRDVADVAEQGK